MLGALAALLLVFQVGVATGFRKARFTYDWGESYHRNFGGPAGGMLDNFRGRDFTDAHGVSGKILKIDGDTVVIRGGDGLEKLVHVGGNCEIKRFRDSVAVGDLAVDDAVVVIGSPDADGRLEAKLVRLLPPGAADRQFRAPRPCR